MGHLLLNLYSVLALIVEKLFLTLLIMLFDLWLRELLIYLNFIKPKTMNFIIMTDLNPKHLLLDFHLEYLSLNLILDPHS